jgi:hypothetical protein
MKKKAIGSLVEFIAGDALSRGAKQSSKQHKRTCGSNNHANTTII